MPSTGDVAAGKVSVVPSPQSMVSSRTSETPGSEKNTCSAVDPVGGVPSPTMESTDGARLSKLASRESVPLVGSPGSSSSSTSSDTKKSPLSGGTKVNEDSGETSTTAPPIDSCQLYVNVSAEPGSVTTASSVTSSPSLPRFSKTPSSTPSR